MTALTDRHADTSPTQGPRWVLSQALFMKSLFLPLSSPLTSWYRVVVLTLCVFLLVWPTGCRDDADTDGASAVENNTPGPGAPDVGDPMLDDFAAPGEDVEGGQDVGDPDAPGEDERGEEDAGDPADVEEPTDADTPDVAPPDAAGDDEDAGEGDDGGEDEPVDPDALTILSVSPPRGSVEGGTEIAIEVNRGVLDPVVQIDGRMAREVSQLSPTLILAVTPAGAVGLADVKVRDGEEVDTLEGGFSYVAPMRLSSVSPVKGSSAGGDLVEIVGEAFPLEVQVSIGGRAAITVERLSDTRLLAVTPPGVAGLVDVRVTDSFSAASLEEAYLYFDSVSIDTLFPAAGPRAGGQVIVMTGTGLSEDTTVRLGQLEAQVRHINDGRLEVTTPPGPLGPVDVVVLNRNGAAGLPGGYSYLDDDAEDLTVASVLPSRGPAAGGQEVIISGRGFDADDLEVRIGDGLAALIEVSDQAMRVRTPVGAPGEVDVTVSNAQGEASLARGYTYVETLEVLAVEPNNGPVAGGQPVTLIGEGFDGDTRFSIGPLPLESVEIVNATTARGITPPGSLGLNAVTARRGVQRVTLEDGYLYTAPARIDSITPQRGSIAGDTLLTILGEGFVSGAQVQLGNLSCLNVEVIDPATITCRTPPSREGALAVRVFQGEDAVTAPDPYIYFNPASRFGGAWGESLGGTVNISVFSIRGEAVEGAFVMLSTDGSSRHQGFTDERGLVTFSGDDVFGTQTVSATAAGFSSATMQAIDAENITLLLVPVVPPTPGGGGGGGPALPVITGQVSGFQKIGQPGPDERQIIIVETTRQSPFRANPWPGQGNVVDPNGDRTYTLNSRLGDLAVIAWGGLINDRTGKFTPYAIGVRRFLFTSQGETYEVDLELNIDLDQRMSFKLNGAQLEPGGPNVNRVIPWVDLGFEGVFGNYDVAEGEGDIITAEHQAPLVGELSDASYYVYGGSWTNSSSPYSLSVIPELRDGLDSLIEMPDLVGIPRPLLPEDGGVVDENGYIAFDPGNNLRPDFWHVQIYQLPATLVWEATMPGEQTWFFLPRFPDFSDLPLEERPTPYAYDGSLYMIISGARIEDFEFSQHEYLNDIRSRDRWESWTRNAYFIRLD